MTQVKRSFLEILRVWSRKSWTLFASEKNKRFWCSIAGQYKITLHSKKIPSKIIYIGENVKKAYQVWLDN